jgi:hypothetical protein
MKRIRIKYIYILHINKNSCTKTEYHQQSYLLYKTYKILGIAKQPNAKVILMPES